MEINEYVVGLVAVVMGSLIILIPLAGLTARFALKPFMGSFNRFMEQKTTDETVRILERRLNLVEQQLQQIEQGVERIEEAQTFDRRLRSGTEAGARAADPGKAE